MTFEDVIKIATAILLSLGGGCAVVFALSSWLGKVWANRIMINAIREDVGIDKSPVEYHGKR